MGVSVRGHLFVGVGAKVGELDAPGRETVTVVGQAWHISPLEWRTPPFWGEPQGLGMVLPALPP